MRIDSIRWDEMIFDDDFRLIDWLIDWFDDDWIRLIDWFEDSRFDSIRWFDSFGIRLYLVCLYACCCCSTKLAFYTRLRAMTVRTQYYHAFDWYDPWLDLIKGRDWFCRHDIKTSTKNKKLYNLQTINVPDTRSIIDTVEGESYRRW